MLSRCATIDTPSTFSPAGRISFTWVTNDLERRVRQHREHKPYAYTARYNIDRLVWYRIFGYIHEAIACEKEIKAWRREKKISLIEAMNPTWADLSAEWGKPITLAEITRSHRER